MGVCCFSERRVKEPWILGLALPPPFPCSTLLQPRAQSSVMIQCQGCLPCSSGMLQHPELWAYSRQTCLEKLGGWSHLWRERGQACCQLHCRVASCTVGLPEHFHRVSEGLEASRGHFLWGQAGSWWKGLLPEPVSSFFLSLLSTYYTRGYICTEMCPASHPAVLSTSFLPTACR